MARVAVLTILLSLLAANIWFSRRADAQRVLLIDEPPATFDDRFYFGHVTDPWRESRCGHNGRDCA